MCVLRTGEYADHRKIDVFPLESGYLCSTAPRTQLEQHNRVLRRERGKPGAHHPFFLFSILRPRCIALLQCHNRIEEERSNENYRFRLL